MALPAKILIDRSGDIVWMSVSTAVQDRIDPEELLHVLDEQLR